jgi:hypothetical protein
VDHTTVTFEGAAEIHDDPRSGAPRRHEEDVDGDGDSDLVFHFRLGDTDLSCDSTEGTLTGETFDGQSIEGTDSVNMIGSEGSVTCPCEGASNPTGTVTWNDQFHVIRCLVFPDSIAVTDGTLKLLEAHGPEASTNANFCEMVDLNGQTLSREITGEEFEACNDSLRQIAANDGVICPEFP